MILCSLPVLVGWATKGFTKFKYPVKSNSRFSGNKRNACQMFINQKKKSNVIYIFSHKCHIAHKQDKFEAPRKGKYFFVI